MMTLTLTPEQERRLKAKAHRAQKSIEAVLDDFLADAPDDTEPDDAECVAQSQAAQREKNQGAIDLLGKWVEEDATMSDQEKEKTTQQLNDLLANLHINRTQIGDEPAQ